MAHTSRSLRGSVNWILLLVALVVVAAVVITPMNNAPKARAAGEGYWHTDGRQLEDAAGNPVRITGINWYGFEDGAKIPHGLNVRDYRSMMDQIKALGYNTIRLPYSNDVTSGGATPNSGYLTIGGTDPVYNTYQNRNGDLAGLTSQQVMDKIVDYAGTIGLKIILDRHRPTSGGQSALWYGAGVDETRWINDWKALAQRYLGKTQVIGADLHNEPHNVTNASDSACWGCANANLDWKAAATRAGNAIHTINPDWLIIIEGIGQQYDSSGNPVSNYWWGGNLNPAKGSQITLTVPNRLVYSVHDYPLSIWEAPGHPWFFAANYPENLDCVWDYYWGWLMTGQSCSTGTADFAGTETRTAVAGWTAAPVLLGEFGTKLQHAKDPQWLTKLTNYLGTGATGINWTFWDLNPDSSDTGGILQGDWVSVETAKQNYLTPIQFALTNSGTGPTATRTNTPVPNAPTATNTTAPATGTNLALNKSATASSQQASNTTVMGNDSSTTTRWCANDGNLNHWWRVDLGAGYNLTGSEVFWERSNTNYKYKVEVSSNNTSWTMVVDKTNNTSTAQTQSDSFTANNVRYVRITITGMPSGTWASFFDFKVFGGGGASATATNTTAPAATATHTATRTNTPVPASAMATRTNTPAPTTTPTTQPSGGGGACSPVSATITAPYTYDGTGTYCWKIATVPSYINSWNTDGISVNGTSYTNTYVGAGSLPAKIDGYYYISFSSTVSWAHIEVR